jgi:hypothetical protein
VLCAPSEEDEIKWLAAFRALLNREREKSSAGVGIAPMSPGEGGRSLSGGVNVPIITAQPPTPASSGLDVSQLPPDSNVDRSSGMRDLGISPPIATPIGSLGLRGRSATYVAKGAVADVVKRFHPEREVQQ